MAKAVLKKLKIPKVQTEKFVKDYDKAISEAYYTSAKMSIIAASSKIPVWTGMAKAAFLADVTLFEGNTVSAEQFGLRDSPHSINIKSLIPKEAKTGEWWYKEGIEKRTIEGGRSRAYIKFLKDRFKYNLVFNTWINYFYTIAFGGESVDTFKSVFGKTVSGIIDFLKPDLKEYIK